MTPQQKAAELNPHTFKKTGGIWDAGVKAWNDGFLAGCAFAQSEAVRFGEWIFRKQYDRLGHKEVLWRRLGNSDEHIFTTAQLYEQFKKEDHG